MLIRIINRLNKLAKDQGIQQRRTFVKEVKSLRLAVVDRGYRGARKHIPDEVDILLPSPPLKRDTAYQRQKKRILCRRRAAMEPIIGHLQHDYRLSRNWLKRSQGDAINAPMAACAWNLKKWMVAFFLFDNNRLIVIESKEQCSESAVMACLLF